MMILRATKWLSCALLLLAVMCQPAAGAATRVDTLRERLMSADKSSVMVVAHRGDWRYAPENSIAAIRHSIDVGVDVVELDLQLTKDSVLVVMHDSRLDRTTTGKGLVRDWPLDSIKTLRLKNGCGIKTMHGVPTLEEALLEAKDRVLVNLDKADRYFDLLMPVLEKTGTARQVIVKGPKPAAEVHSLYGAYIDKIIYMPKLKLDRPEARELMTGFFNVLKPVVYELSYSADHAVSYAVELKDMLDGKALIWYNTLCDTQCGGHDDEVSLVDADASYGYLIDTLGASIIQTDRAEHLLEYLRGRGLHD